MPPYQVAVTVHVGPCQGVSRPFEIRDWHFRHDNEARYSVTCAVVKVQLVVLLVNPGVLPISDEAQQTAEIVAHIGKFV